MNPYLPKFVLYKNLTNVSLIALIALFMGMQLTRQGGPNWFIFFIQALPFMAILPGLIRQRYRSYSWLCFIILLYFVLAVMAAFSSISTYLDYIYVLLTVLTFIFSMMCSRYAQRVQKNITD